MKLISSDLVSVLNSQGQNGTSVNVTVSGGTTPQGYAGQVNNVSGNRNNLMSRYLMKRAVSLVIIGLTLIVILYSSMFTDLGLNIGELLLRFLGF